MHIENEYCGVELLFDDPQRVYREGDSVSGTVVFNARQQQLSVNHHHLRVVLSVDLYGSENACRVRDQFDESFTLESVSGVSDSQTNSEGTGLDSAIRVGIVRRSEDYEEMESSEPLEITAGSTSEIQFSLPIGTDLPYFRGELLGCRPAVILSFSASVTTDDGLHYIEEEGCEPIQFEPSLAGDTEGELREQAAKITNLMETHVEYTQEWPLARLLMWGCLLLIPMLAVFPMLEPDFNPGNNILDGVCLFIFGLGCCGPAPTGAVMLIVFTRRWLRNKKPDAGRTADPSVGCHAVYLLDGRDRLMYFVYWDTRRTHAEPRLNLKLDFREACLADETDEPVLIHDKPVAMLELSLEDATSIAGGLLLKGTVPFTDDLPAMLLPERPGWVSDEQVWELSLFLGLFVRLETEEGQDLSVTYEVVPSK
jgi:hypothetical protein